MLIEARVLAETGVSSSVASTVLVILPPWWRTWPAFAADGLAVALLAYGTYRLRVRSLKRRTVELEAMVAKRTEQAQQANAAKTDFVARVSHDIRNPLNGIVGLSLALQDADPNPKQQQLIQALENCAHYLTRLVDDVLDFARIEAGKVDLHPAPASPRAVLQSVMSILQTEAENGGSKFEISVDPTLPEYVQLDIGRLEEIMLNFGTNAVRYAGGDIRLYAGRCDQADVVEFSVTDHGAGFTEEEQAVLFTKFTRLADPNDNPVRGSGLGLAVCRRLADLMGGSVGVRSAPGHGACFYVQLPLVQTEYVAQPAAVLATFERLLLVEDIDYNVWAMTAVLSRLGLPKADVARTGREAIALGEGASYDLVLVDRNLPDMDGIAIAQRLRQLPTQGKRPVIISISAFSTTEDREACLAAGMDGFVGKPLTPEKLRRALFEAGMGFLPSLPVDIVEPPERSRANGINLDLLTYLSDGNAGTLADKVERYCAMLRREEQNLRGAVSSGDAGAVRGTAHHILGLGRMIDAEGLCQAAVAVQEAAGTGVNGQLPGLSRCLEAAIEELISQLVQAHCRPRTG